MVDRFKIIKEESFEQVNPYLRLAYQVTDGTYPFAFVTIDGIDYLITQVADDRYVTVYNKDGNYQLVGTGYDKDTVTLCDEKIAYRLSDNGELIRENQDNLFKERLLIYNSIESDPKVIMNFSQVDPLNKRDVHMNFNINGYANPLVALNYINSRVPVEIVISKYPFILEHQVRYANCDNLYMRYLRIDDDTIRALPFLRSYTRDEMNYYIQSMGFNTEVPSDLIEMYKNDDSEVKVLKRVADEYRKNARV